MSKIKTMYFKLLFLCVLTFIEAAYEGEQCTKDGRTGKCVIIGKCKTAIEEIKNGLRPQICGFVQSEPIVCCFDSKSGTVTITTTTPIPPVATTMKRPVQTTTTGYVPPEYDYRDVTNKTSQCKDIDPTMTSKKTGQKAFDKCIEYQEQFVYPCEKSVSLSFTTEITRQYHCHHNADELIVGGTDAAKNEFPHMVMLGYGENPRSLSWLCGGAIISNRYILTAGHCTFSREVGEITYVLIGAHTRQDAQNESYRYKVKRIIKYPDYKPPSKYHDIALLETVDTIRLSQYVVPACLHVGDAIADDRVLATGWGLTDYKGSTSEILQKVILHKFSTQECSEKYPINRLMRNGLDPETQTCYGDRTEAKDTCQGDSGGPLQIKSKSVHCMYTVVGVTSFGRGCGFPGEPAIYTRVAHYVPWIESIVWP